MLLILVFLKRNLDQSNPDGCFWECPNGGKNCKYRHVIPNDNKSEIFRKPLNTENSEGKLLKLNAKTPITDKIFIEWRNARCLKNKLDKNQKKPSGRDIFEGNYSARINLVKDIADLDLNVSKRCSSFNLAISLDSKTILELHRRDIEKKGFELKPTVIAKCRCVNTKFIKEEARWSARLSFYIGGLETHENYFIKSLRNKKFQRDSAFL